METNLIVLTLAVSAISLAISIYLALKMKTVSYLLEQPVVKKMSPQLKLKPVNVDERMAERNRQQQQQNRDQRPQGGNPNHRHNHGGQRDDRRQDQDRKSTRLNSSHT